MTIESILAELKIYLTNPEAFSADRVYAAGKVGTFDVGTSVPEPIGVPENDRLTYDPYWMNSILGRLKGYTATAGVGPAAVAATRMERRA